MEAPTPRGPKNLGWEQWLLAVPVLVAVILLLLD